MLDWGAGSVGACIYIIYVLILAVLLLKVKGMNVGRIKFWSIPSQSCANLPV